MDMSKIIHQEPIQIGGHTVTANVPDDYKGPSAIFCETNNMKILCAFPTYTEAMIAARYASTPDGGYGSVVIEPCCADQITHAEFIDWAF